MPQQGTAESLLMMYSHTAGRPPGAENQSTHFESALAAEEAHMTASLSSTALVTMLQSRSLCTGCGLHSTLPCSQLGVLLINAAGYVCVGGAPG
jgi:hypothetical protein